MYFFYPIVFITLKHAKNFIDLLIIFDAYYVFPSPHINSVRVGIFICFAHSYIPNVYNWAFHILSFNTEFVNKSIYNNCKNFGRIILKISTR